MNHKKGLPWLHHTCHTGKRRGRHAAASNSPMYVCMRAGNSREIMTDLHWEAERMDRIGSWCLSADERMLSRNTATLHQVGALQVSMSPSFQQRHTDPENRFNLFFQKHR